MKKFVYFDMETKNDPSIMGWKNFSSHGMSVGVLGYPANKNESLDENAESVKHLLPSKFDLSYEIFHDPTKLFNRIKLVIEKGFTLVGYNTILYDNNLLSNLVGKINPEMYLNIPIGGKKAETTWGEVDNGYLTFLVNNKAGSWEIAESMLQYRQQIESIALSEEKSNELIYINDIKNYIDNNSYDIMKEMSLVTGNKWVAPFDLVCSMTIGCGKSDDGAKVPEMYKDGKIEQIEKYCIHDVRLTWLLHEFMLKYKYVLVPQFKDMFNLTKYQAIKVPFDGSVKGMNEQFVHFTELL